MQIGFMVPGFSKCGTTSLCILLGRHPEIFIPKIKEPGYYAQHYERGVEYYTSFYSHPREARLLGEGSTTYSSSQFAAVSCKRIVSDYPDIRFIFMARNPYKRLESSFRELHTNGFRYKVHAEFDIGRALVKANNLLLDTQYWKLISCYRRLVSDEQILVLFLEEFQRNPNRHLRRCFEFLGVDPTLEIKGTSHKFNSKRLQRYDTRTMRVLRKIPFLNKQLASWPKRDERRWGDLLGLRKPFVGPIKWDNKAISLVEEALFDDSRQFLEHYGRSKTLWSWRPRQVDSAKRES